MLTILRFALVALWLSTRVVSQGGNLVRNLLQGLYLLVVLSRVVSRVVHLVARLLTQLCEKEELVGVVSHILEAG